jgi:hypothetical protein
MMREIAAILAIWREWAQARPGQLRSGRLTWLNFLMTQGGKADQQARREQRLRAALRENLKRRKAQARGRADSRHGEASAPPRDDGEEAATRKDDPDFRRNRVRE